MPDYQALEALADVGAGIVQPDLTDDLRPNKETPPTSTAKNRVEGSIITNTEQE